MPSLCARFLRETMIWPNTQLKKSLDIFWPRLERKRLTEYKVILLVVKRKLWKIFLPRVHLEKQQTRPSRLKNFSLNLQGFIHDSGFSGTGYSQIIHVFVNKYCCPFKCFIELHFLSWFFVKIFFLLLCQLFSVVHESHAGVLKMPRVTNSLKDYGVSELKCKRKWFRELFLLGVLDFLNNY